MIYFKNGKFLLLLLCFQIGYLTSAQEAELDYESFFADLPQSELLMLGTFHFKDAGLDGYKPQTDVNILSEKRQQELSILLEAIKKFAPTKIALEVKKDRQERLDSLYQAYLEGNFELKANEIYQVGFRLAKMLGHQKVYAVDTWGLDCFPDMDKDAYQEKEQYFVEKASPAMLAREQDMNERYFKLYKAGDQAKAKATLREMFLYMNDPGRMSMGHGHYLIGSFKMGEGNDYFGADMAMNWYSRNIRIFQNLLHLQEPGKDKVFLLIGAGHMPILNFLADASPDFDKKHIKQYLK